MNSCTIVPVTNAHNAKHKPDAHSGTSSAATAAPTAMPATTGQTNCVTRCEIVDLRQASSGAMPVSTSSTRPIGCIHLL